MSNDDRAKELVESIAEHCMGLFKGLGKLIALVTVQEIAAGVNQRQEGEGEPTPEAEASPQAVPDLIPKTEPAKKKRAPRSKKKKEATAETGDRVLAAICEPSIANVQTVLYVLHGQSMAAGEESAAMALVASYGVKRVTELDEEKRAALLIDAINKLDEAHYAAFKEKVGTPK